MDKLCFAVFHLFSTSTNLIDLMLILCPSKGFCRIVLASPQYDLAKYSTKRGISRKYTLSIDRSGHSIKFKLAFRHPRTP